MKTSFYVDNRRAFGKYMESGELAIFLSGEALRKSADDDYPFYANRNFIYLTGIEQRDSILMLYKDGEGLAEKLFILAPDAFEERWNGARIKPEDAAGISGMKDIAYFDEWQSYFAEMVREKRIQSIYLDIDHKVGRRNWNGADWMRQYIETGYPQIELKNALPILKKMRLIKKPCEIEALEQAERITKSGFTSLFFISYNHLKIP